MSEARTYAQWAQARRPAEFPEHVAQQLRGMNREQRLSWLARFRKCMADGGDKADELALRLGLEVAE